MRMSIVDAEIVRDELWNGIELTMGSASELEVREISLLTCKLKIKYVQLTTWTLPSITLSAEWTYLIFKLHVSLLDIEQMYRKDYKNSESLKREAAGKSIPLSPEISKGCKTFL